MTEEGKGDEEKGEKFVVVVGSIPTPLPHYIFTWFLAHFSFWYVFHIIFDIIYNMKFPGFPANLSPFKVFLVWVHILYIVIILLVYIVDKSLIALANYYISVFFQILISVFLMYKFHPWTPPPVLNDDDAFIIFSAGTFLIFTTLTTGVVGKLMQQLSDTISPYKMDVDMCNL